MLLWRGHYAINLCNCVRFKVPLHSIIALGLGVMYTEYPQYSVSIFFFLIVWFMLAMLEHRHRRPSCCDSPPTYLGLLFRLITGISYPEDIERHEISQESVDLWVAKGNANLAEANKAFDAYVQSMEAVGEDRIDMKDALGVQRDSMRMNFLKNLLYPYQVLVLEICYTVRFVQNVLLWKHRYIAFWITTISLALSISCFFLWEDVWLWTKRILVYGFLGPWMKVLDWVYFRRLERMTDEEKAARERKRIRRLRSWDELDYKSSRSEAEKTVKLASMKKHMFGNVSYKFCRLLSFILSSHFLFIH